MGKFLLFIFILNVAVFNEFIMVNKTNVNASASPIRTFIIENINSSSSDSENNQSFPAEINHDYSRLNRNKNGKLAIIVEVNGNPEERKRHIEKNLPHIEVVTTFDTLLQGVALKVKKSDLRKLFKLQFIEGIYPAQTYISLTNHFVQDFKMRNDDASFILTPERFNNTPYTGKGVKVAVIDTGIDMSHPDLAKNYAGGFDLVDLDDKPMETTKEQGAPTAHGTHVAGIIGANGQMKGVAPGVQLYAYRALGPGGVGNSIQVIAAMEQAIKDGVHIMNLSLGNNVNTPDYPTSKAVQVAVEKGVIVIVANGNDGPNNWTIGAPATASAAFSVGAYESLRQLVTLYEPISSKTINIQLISPTSQWTLARDYQLAQFSESDTYKDKIVLLSQMENNLVTKINDVVHHGAIAILIKQVEDSKAPPLQYLRDESFPIPVAVISEEDGNWLERQKNHLFYKTVVTDVTDVVAPFSSRGPVSVNWQIKPNVLAPGVNIISTIPDGYDVFSGTSMAAPHVAGAAALIKEAQPKWTNKQIVSALETTAHRLVDQSGEFVAPHIQGAGLIQVDRAVNTNIIVENGLLSFGKVNEYIKDKEVDVTFHNVANKDLSITIEQPKKSKGLHWQIPRTFTIKPSETVTKQIKVTFNQLFLEKGIQSDWIKVTANDEQLFLPYSFINETDDFQKITGFSIRINPIRQDQYKYELYATEKAKSVQVQLFDPETLLYETTLLTLNNLSPGLYEGEMNKRDLSTYGTFYSLIIVELIDGTIEHYETMIEL